MSLSDSDYKINPFIEKYIPCPPQTSPNNISQDLVPEWYNEVVPSSNVEHAKKYAKNDFLTPSLIGEIQSLFPTSNHIDVTNNHSRSKTAFSQNCEKLFPTNRIFLNREQFVQAAKMFCAKWAVQCRHKTKAI